MNIKSLITKLKISESNNQKLIIQDTKPIKHSMKTAINELASMTGCKKNHIILSVYKTPKRNDRYTKYEIKKNNGNIRTIHIPEIGLKFLQKKIIEYFNKQNKEYQPTDSAFAYIKNKGIIKNAKKHKNKKIIIRIDIKDFFPSITFARVMGMFQNSPYNYSKELSILLAQIFCLDDNGPIPQGAPSSPYISNMIARSLDGKIKRYCTRNFTYTRYSDDIVVSTNKNLDPKTIIGDISNIIESEKFNVNKNKTLIMRDNDRKIINGIVVNKGLNVPKKYYDSVKALLHNCKTKNLKSNIGKNDFKDMRNTCANIKILKGDNGNAFYKMENGNKKIINLAKAKKIFLNHIDGRISFIGQVAKANIIPNDKKNNELYSNRIEKFEKLKQTFREIAVKENFHKRSFEEICPELIDYREKHSERKNKIDENNYNFDEELIFIKSMADKDPRFYLFNLEIEKDSNKFKSQLSSLL